MPSGSSQSKPGRPTCGRRCYRRKQVNTQIRCGELSRTHILVSFEAEPPAIFCTRKLKSSPFNSASCLDKSFFDLETADPNQHSLQHLLHWCSYQRTWTGVRRPLLCRAFYGCLCAKSARSSNTTKDAESSGTAQQRIGCRS